MVGNGHVKVYGKLLSMVYRWCTWEEWKNCRGVLSLSESLSLFFPLPRLPPRRQAHDRKLPSQDTHTSKTRPVHKLDTERTWRGKANECVCSAVGMERASIYAHTHILKLFLAKR